MVPIPILLMLILKISLINYGVGFEVGGGIGVGKTILIALVGQMTYHFPRQSAGGVILFSQNSIK